MHSFKAVMSASNVKSAADYYTYVVLAFFPSSSYHRDR